MFWDSDNVFYNNMLCTIQGDVLLQLSRARFSNPPYSQHKQERQTGQKDAVCLSCFGGFLL